ncbi:MAG TPA: DoxX family protein [Acidobacteriota bacterium]|nr:DoxX family protein [Acidobacteriota bacterium]
MANAKSIIYWISTLWLALGMFSTGIVQVLQTKTEVDFVVALGYPAYVLIILGVWKLLSVVAILIPKFPLVKEWAYAGIFFTMTGAIFSHLAVKDPLTAILPGLLLTVLTIVSWYTRPESRKLTKIK